MGIRVKLNHLRIVEDVAGFHNNVWRHHDCLVVQTSTVFPQKCVQCGRAAEHTIPKWIFWHTPLLLPVVLVSWPFYLLVALLIRKHMTIQIPLCSHHFKQRRWFSLLGITLIPLAIFFLISAIVLSIPSLILAALLSCLTAAIIIGKVRNSIWAIRFVDDVAFVKNVHPSILGIESLPEWEDYKELG